MRTGTGARLRAPSATLPTRKRAAPPAPRAPRASIPALSSRTVRSNSGSGTPIRTVPRARHPARLRRVTAASTSRRAARTRAAMSARTRPATAARTEAGTSASEGALTGSTTRTTTALPRPDQRARWATTREAWGDPSSPTTTRRDAPARRVLTPGRAAALAASISPRGEPSRPASPQWPKWAACSSCSCRSFSGCPCRLRSYSSAERSASSASEVVKMPTIASPSRTGRQPIFRSSSTRAATVTGVSGATVTGSSVMMRETA